MPPSPPPPSALPEWAGRTPAWISAKLIGQSGRAWLEVVSALPGAKQRKASALLSVGQVLNPFDGLGTWRKRITAMRYLDDLYADIIRAHGVALELGDLTVDAWRRAVEAEADRLLLQGYQVGSGSLDVLVGGNSIERLDRLREALHDRLGSLADRLSAGEISPAQARAWSAQATRGHARSAHMVGGSTWMGEEPVRRRMTAEVDSCTTCPTKVGLYKSFDECEAECGGLPGDGSDDCHGNCLCYIEPAELLSVYADTRNIAILRVAA